MIAIGIRKKKVGGRICIYNKYSNQYCDRFSNHYSCDTFEWVGWSNTYWVLNTYAQYVFEYFFLSIRMWDGALCVLFLLRSVCNCLCGAIGIRILIANGIRQRGDGEYIFTIGIQIFIEIGIRIYISM